MSKFPNFHTTYILSKCVLGCRRNQKTFYYYHYFNDKWIFCDVLNKNLLKWRQIFFKERGTSIFSIAIKAGLLLFHRNQHPTWRNFCYTSPSANPTQPTIRHFYTMPNTGEVQHRGFKHQIYLKKLREYELDALQKETKRRWAHDELSFSRYNPQKHFTQHQQQRFVEWNEILNMTNLKPFLNLVGSS